MAEAKLWITMIGNFLMYRNVGKLMYLWNSNPDRSSLATQMVKKLPAMQETWVWSLGWEDSMEKGTATHSSILVWRISWTEEPGRLQSMGSQRYICMYIYILYIYILSHDYPSSLTSIVNTMAETNILKRYWLEKRMPELEDEWMCKWTSDEWMSKQI